MYKLEFYVPDANLDATLAGLFSAGAGRIGNYDSCCWTTRGTGQFRPLAGSSPHLGRQGDIEQVPEVKVELVFATELKQAVVAALLEHHPYETPAYQILRVET